MKMASNVGGTPTTMFFSQTEVIKSINDPKNLRPIKPITTPKNNIVIVWRNVLIFAILHAAALYGFYIVVTLSAKITYIYTYTIGSIGGIGVTAGAHRLWAHKAYKARWPLRVLLAILQTFAVQNCIYEWVRDHRVHHKFTDTDADPHNSKRGFFFSHIGWLMVKKHNDVALKGKTIDMSDIEKDWVVMAQKRFYLIGVLIIAFVIPIYIPIYLWNEDPWNSIFVAGIYRYTISLNYTWLVNSAAHFWGTKQYDRSISSTENKMVAILTSGEGWHNYHHVFPWDYKAAELGNYSLNLTTAFIDFFAKIGWAYNLKSVPEEMVRNRVLRTGDGTKNIHSHEGEIWGWDDIDITDEDKNQACITHNKEN